MSVCVCEYVYIHNMETCRFAAPLLLAALDLLSQLTHMNSTRVTLNLHLCTAHVYVDASFNFHRRYIP